MVHAVVFCVHDGDGRDGGEKCGEAQSPSPSPSPNRKNLRLTTRRIASACGRYSILCAK